MMDTGSQIRSGLKPLMNPVITTTIVTAIVAAVLYGAQIHFTEYVGSLLEIDGDLEATKYASSLISVVGVFGICFFGLSILTMAVYTRPLIRMGLTRTSIIWINLILCTLTALTASVVAAGVTWYGFSTVPDQMSVFFETSSAPIIALSVFLTVLQFNVAGALGVALFLRFKWWVATAIIILAVIALNLFDLNILDITTVLSLVHTVTTVGSVVSSAVLAGGFYYVVKGIPA